MNIDWKAVARSPGYRSLKAAYMHDVHDAGRHPNPMRKKAELLKKFRWVIGRALHYAHHTGEPLEKILNQWEFKRDYWWINYYGEYKQPKQPSGKPRNVQPPRLERYYGQQVKAGWVPRETLLGRIRKERTRLAKRARLKAGKKPRWGAEKKRRLARYR